MRPEKHEYIKHWLFRANEDINVKRSLIECQKIDRKLFEIDIKSLTDFGVSVRYPDDFYVPGLKEALGYRDIAINIKEIIDRKIHINL